MFPDPINGLFLNMSILICNIHGNVAKGNVYVMLQIYLSEKIDPGI